MVLSGDVVGSLDSVAPLADMSHWGQALKVIPTSSACPSFLLSCSPVWEDLPPHAPTHDTWSQARRHDFSQQDELYPLNQK